MQQKAIMLTVFLFFLLLGCTKQAPPENYFPIENAEKLEYSYVLSSSANGSQHEEKGILVIRPGSTKTIGSKECTSFSFEFNGEKDHSECYYSTKDGVMLAGRGFGLEKMEVKPAMPLLKKPFTAGNTWSWVGKEGSISSSAEFETDGIETITLGSQELEVLKVSSTVKRSDGVEMRSTKWFAGSLGLVKEQTTITNSNYPGQKMEVKIELKL